MIYHIISLLLAGWLKHRDHGEIAINTVVLLILGRVHGWVVGRKDDHTSVDTAHSGVHKAIGGYIQTHVLHAAKRTFTGIAHTQSGFHGGFLIRAPATMDTSFLRYRRTLDIFCDFSRRGSRVCVHPGDTSVYSGLRYGLVPQK